MIRLLCVFHLFLLSQRIVLCYGLKWLLRSPSSTGTRSVTHGKIRAFNFQVNAKSKGSRLISDDLFLVLNDENPSSVRTFSTIEGGVALAANDKKQKRQKISADSVMKPSKDDMDTKSVFDKPDNDKVSNNGENQQISITGDDLLSPAAVNNAPRKDKPSSRIRFVESSQPDFVSIGLEKVGLTFGNEVILKDATLSVSSGDRVGLVGPNGGGKVRGVVFVA